MSVSPVSGRMTEFVTLRVKRVPAAPSLGSARLFQLPSAVRKWTTPGGGGRPCGWKQRVAVEEADGGDIHTHLGDGIRAALCQHLLPQLMVGIACQCPLVVRCRLAVLLEVVVRGAGECRELSVGVICPQPAQRLERLGVSACLNETYDRSLLFGYLLVVHDFSSDVNSFVSVSYRKPQSGNESDPTLPAREVLESSYPPRQGLSE